jgi:uncharacterized protein YjiS (DUF1127 family)
MPCPHSWLTKPAHAGSAGGAYIALQQQRAAAAGFGGRPAGHKGTVMINRIVARIRAYRRYRETVEQLSRLSDRQLEDLGIRRFDIERTARI